MCGPGTLGAVWDSGCSPLPGRHLLFGRAAVTVWDGARSGAAVRLELLGRFLGSPTLLGGLLPTPCLAAGLTRRGRVSKGATVVLATQRVVLAKAQRRSRSRAAPAAALVLLLCRVDFHPEGSPPAQPLDISPTSEKESGSELRSAGGRTSSPGVSSIAQQGCVRGGESWEQALGRGCCSPEGPQTEKRRALTLALAGGPFRGLRQARSRSKPPSGGAVLSRATPRTLAGRGRVWAAAQRLGSFCGNRCVPRPAAASRPAVLAPGFSPFVQHVKAADRRQDPVGRAAQPCPCARGAQAQICSPGPDGRSLSSQGPRVPEASVLF